MFVIKYKLFRFLSDKVDSKDWASVHNNVFKLNSNNYNSLFDTYYTNFNSCSNCLKLIKKAGVGLRYDNKKLISLLVNNWQNAKPYSISCTLR